MDSLSDEEIELLKGSVETSKGQDNIDSNINPLNIFNRSNSYDDSGHMSSIHALQTAFTSLQRKLKEKDKKLTEVTHKNKLMQRQLQEYKQGTGNMDEYFDVHDPIPAAGATGGDDMVAAESRASEGLIRHLQREILVRDNALTKTQEELFRMKYEKEENEKRHLRDKDRLESSYEVLSHSLKQKEQDCAIKDNEIQNLTENLQQLKQENDRLQYENNEIKENIHKIERSSQIHNQTELQDLRTKLNFSENERKKLAADFEKVRKEKDSLDVKCKQLDIEVKINRDNHQSLKQMEEADDVDGDIYTLTKALDIVNSQRIEYAELKKKVQDQADIIKQLTTNYKGPSRAFFSEPRYAAQGASFHPLAEESSTNDHVYMNTMAARNMGHSRSSSNLETQPQPLTRRQSDRSDYRSSNKTSPVTRGMGINGSVVSSSHHIPQMMAHEMSQPIRQANVVDSLRSPRSPRASRDERRYENSDTVDKIPTVSSPQPQVSASNYRPAVPIVPTYSDHNIPARPAQTNEQSVTRSVLEPVQPLEIPDPVNRMDARRHQPHDSRRPYSPQSRDTELRRAPNTPSNIGPDYENIYNTQAQTETKRPIEESEEPRFVTCNDKQSPVVINPVQDQNNEVSAVKICPVCNLEFSRLKMDDFQMHVFECFDNQDESPATLQPAATGNDEDRTCPMCNETFPLTIPQETYEQHVLAHFGEDPEIERFEMLHP